MTNDEQTLRLLTPTATDFVEVAVLERDGIVESRHRGIAALVGPDGKVIAHRGSAKRLVYPRSAIKPIQVVAMQRAGMKLTGAQLVITAASHQATPAHQLLVEQVLASVGLNPDALQCPVAWPGNFDARAGAAGQTRVAFNCSGKHAGFLAATVAAGWDTATYLQLDHPIQQLTKTLLEEYSGERILKTTVDGCGAPLHLMTVSGIATAMGRFVANHPDIVAEMLEYPWVIGDISTPDAIFMGEGIAAKLGAEGVFVAGLADGHGVAVKIADGSLRAAPLVALKLLHDAGLVSDEVNERLLERLAVHSMGGSVSLGVLSAI